MSTATLTEHHAATQILALTNFSVDVVDGDGLPVAYQQVAVHYRYASAPLLWASASTDADGRAQFIGHHAEPPLDVTLVSGREQSEPHPLRRDLFTIEM